MMINNNSPRCSHNSNKQNTIKMMMMKMALVHMCIINKKYVECRT